MKSEKELVTPAERVLYYGNRIVEMDKMLWQTESDLLKRDNILLKKKQAIREFLTSPLVNIPSTHNFIKSK